MPRPGYVLEVDRSTPPTLFWHGEGFRLEAKGARNVKMPWQRQEPQCAIYANSQLGNANRTGGARSGKAKAAKPGMN